MAAIAELPAVQHSAGRDFATEAGVECVEGEVVQKPVRLESVEIEVALVTC